MPHSAELESVLGALSIFEHLRPDEVGRIAKRFHVLELAPNADYSADTAQLVVVIDGEVALEVDQGGRRMRARMGAGDRFGTQSIVTGYVNAFVATARAHGATIAVIEYEAFQAVLEAYPAIALPLTREIAAELAVRDDVVRQLLELHAAKLPTEQLRAAIEERRIAQARRGARITRSSTRGLFHRLVTRQGAEPPFWMLVGFLLSLGGARLVVHLILKYKLEKQLFALVPGTDPNPMHIHHFNYGLFLVGIAGLVALLPLGRRALRGLAFAFGLGAGLVFDEFALFWNLNPEYAQELSLIAAGIAAAILLQLVYFRRFWAAVGRRAWLGVRGVR
jgi:CRP-like cAMP-binding protein